MGNWVFSGKHAAESLLIDCYFPPEETVGKLILFLAHGVRYEKLCFGADASH